MSERERDRLAAILAEHDGLQSVNSREGWIKCMCDAELPCVLDRDGNAVDWDEEERVRLNHIADATPRRRDSPTRGRRADH